MKTSEYGINLIIRFEGIRLKAYYCPAGVLTIGVGSTGSHVKPGMVITKAEAIELLHRDLVRFEKAVDRLVKVSINQNQFDALVSFAFNVGEGALQKSTLLRKLNAGDVAGAADQFLVWNRATKTILGRKEVLPGLTTRRQAERHLFLTKPASTFVIPPPAQAPVAAPSPATPTKGLWASLIALFRKDK